MLLHQMLLNRHVLSLQRDQIDANITENSCQTNNNPTNSNESNASKLFQTQTNSLSDV